jgi:hypothetical protein
MEAVISCREMALPFRPWRVRTEARSHERETALAGRPLAAETGGCAGEESRLKAGCSQDWPPHKARSCMQRKDSTVAGRGADRRDAHPAME